MNLAALPRMTGARYADLFADRGDTAAVWMRLTPADARSSLFPRKRRAAFAEAEADRPGSRFVGAFVITDANPDPMRPRAALVGFTFVGGPVPPKPED